MKYPPIGCALPMHYLTEQNTDPVTTALNEVCGSRSALLERLAERGVYSIELRNVTKDHTPEAVLFAVMLCRKAGLESTIHGTMTPDCAESAESFFSPYRKLFSSGLQSVYNITVHALPEKEQALKALNNLLDAVHREQYPVHLTLENNRRKAVDLRSCGDSLSEVCEIVRTFDDPTLSVCWDMGHYTSDMLKFGCCGEQVYEGIKTRPTAEQLACIGHTHIHSVYEGTTHFPLHMGVLPLENYCEGLIAADYPGILSLELDFPRFLSVCSAGEALASSLDRLSRITGGKAQ